MAGLIWLWKRKSVTRNGAGFIVRRRNRPGKSAMDICMLAIGAQQIMANPTNKR